MKDSISHTVKFRHLQDIVDMFYIWKNSIEQMELSDNFKYLLLGYLAYEYYICLGLSRCLSENEGKQLIERLKPLKGLIDYDINYKTKMCKWAYKITGINVASKIYRMYIINK